MSAKEINIKEIKLVVGGETKDFFCVTGVEQSNKLFSELKAIWHPKLSAWVVRAEQVDNSATVTKAKIEVMIADYIAGKASDAEAVAEAVEASEGAPVTVTVEEPKRRKKKELAPEAERVEKPELGELAPINTPATSEHVTQLASPNQKVEVNVKHDAFFNSPLVDNHAGGSLREVMPDSPETVTADKHYVPPKEAGFFLKWLHNHAIGAPSAQRVLLKGFSGCGKSALAEWFAGKTGRPYFELLMPTLSDEGSVFGVTLFTNQQSVKYWSEFVAAIQTPNCVVLLDEINRTPPVVMNYFMSLLDHRGSVSVPNMGRVKVAKGVIFFATANMGPAYTGTFDMDRAQRERFSHSINCGYMEKGAEIKMLHARFPSLEKKDAQHMVEWASAIRDMYHKGEVSDHVSTRQLIAMCDPICGGVPIMEAAAMAVGNAFSIEEEKNKAMELLKARVA